MSKYACIGFAFQLFALSFVFATKGSSQNAMSVKDVSLELEFKDENIEDVFSKIESTSNFDFVYVKKDLQKRGKFSLKKQKIIVSDLLMELSKNYDIAFKQVNQSITVKSINHDQIDQEKLEIIILEDVDISGKITDENGEGLPGASVVVKGTTNGTTTDLDGNYKLSVAESSVITVSFIGYLTQDAVVGVQSVIDLQMKVNAEQLEEVVVIGYGAIKKEDMTGSVSSINH